LLGELDEALAAGIRALVIVRSLQQLEPRLYWRTRKPQQAQEHLTTATTMYREMGMTYWLEQAAAALKECT
jgi:hypothetical protein